MKTLVTNYTFSAAAKQVTFTDYPSIKLDQILLITNVTDNVIIYNFADPTAGGTLASNVLTLTYNTASMSDSDRLQIFIDDYVAPSTEASLTAVQVKLDNTNIGVLAMVADLDEIRANTEFGTTSDAPIFVNPGTLDYITDSVAISGANIDNIVAGVNDNNILQTASTALSSRFVIPGAHRVYNIFGITTAVVNQYIQFYNNFALSGTPIGIFYIPANSNFSFDLERGLNFSNNVVIVNSLTPVAYTPGNDDLFLTVIHN